MIKGIKTLDDFNFKGKRVLVRVDINSPFSGNKIQDNERIESSGATIREIQKNGGRVVVIAHQGQPDKSDFKSLRQHAKLLKRYCKIKFVDDLIERKALAEIDGLNNGEAILLENIRFEKDEYSPRKKGNKIVEAFKDRFDVYINDAFSVSHREHVSIVSFPRYMKSGIGRTFERELKNVGKIELGKTLFVLGGNKTEDLMPLIEKKENKILATGVLGILCNMLEGYRFGLEDRVKKKVIGNLKKSLKRELRHIRTPSDYGFLVNGKRVDKKLEELPVSSRALDIGKETIKRYEREIAKARYVFMKGTAGDCGKKGFCFGTRRLLKAMEKSKAFCVVAGGHSSSAVDKLGINKKKLGYVSLSGGALVKFISGEKLVGIKSLRRR